MIKAKQEKIKEIIERYGGISAVSQKTGLTKAMIYEVMKGASVGKKTIRALTELTGLPWSALFYFDIDVDRKSINKEEGGSNGKEDDRGEPTCRGNHGVAGKTTQKANTTVDACLQETSTPTVRASKVSEKPAGAEPA